MIVVEIIFVQRKANRGRQSLKIQKALHHCKAFFYALNLGLEPRTYGLTVRRSNQLS